MTLLFSSLSAALPKSSRGITPGSPVLGPARRIQLKAVAVPDRAAGEHTSDASAPASGRWSSTPASPPHSGNDGGPRATFSLTRRGDRGVTKAQSVPSLRDAYGAAGLWRPGQMWHVLRHTYASALAGGGIRRGVIERLMGHAGTGTTSLYTHLFRDAFDGVEEALDAAFGVNQASTESRVTTDHAEAL